MKTLEWMAVAVAAWVTGPSAFAEVPRPEHPRPDMFRENWMTLNGEWQFEIDKNADGETRGLTGGKNLNSKIIVPFCPESKLSGLGLGNTEKLKDVWYRRTFEIPPAMKGKRVRIHFGAVDFKTWVYINGRLAGRHAGESPSFDFEITGMLKDGANEVVVKVLDDMWSGLQPSGKQTREQSHGCHYTRTTGIWQPVWIEAVGSSFIENISIVPDPDNSRVMVTAKINGNDSNLSLKAEAFFDGKPAGTDTSTGPGQHSLVLNLTNKKLWEPGSPLLYDLKLTLLGGKDKIDELTSYFGLRKVSIDGRRILINGKPVFQRLILDQGFYPDGLWTAPSDEELRKDIERSMACGYNGARLHQKIFEPRFLYWADKLGYLVWGESPSWGFDYKPEGYSGYINEWTEILIRDRNHPAIVGWCPFNETAAEFAGELTRLMWNITKAIDPTRPALETSGGAHTLPNPEVLDIHDYEANPARFRERWLQNLSVASVGCPVPARYRESAKKNDRGIPFMVSEIGGMGWATEGGWGYGSGPKTLEEFYQRYQGTIDAMLDNPHLFGFCDTQLTDIEQEKNGLYSYDRTPKFDVAKLHAITSRKAACEREEPGEAKLGAMTAGAELKVLIGAVQDGPLATPYRYSVESPADGWTNEGFEDKAWKEGLAPFGHENAKGVRTRWDTEDIYLRKTFEYDGSDLKQAYILICHDVETEVYINGRKVFEVSKDKTGYNSNYIMYPVTEALGKALKKGSNMIAVHTRQTIGDQYIDLALLVAGEPQRREIIPAKTTGNIPSSKP